MKQTRHHSAARDAEIFGDFVVRKSLDLAQGEDGAMFRRERSDCAFESQVTLLVFEILAGVAFGHRFGGGRDAVAPRFLAD
jgi:hypothetical protein